LLNNLLNGNLVGFDLSLQNLQFIFERLNILTEDNQSELTSLLYEPFFDLFTPFIDAPCIKLLFWFVR